MSNIFKYVYIEEYTGLTSHPIHNEYLVDRDTMSVWSRYNGYDQYKRKWESHDKFISTKDPFNHKHYFSDEGWPEDLWKKEKLSSAELLIELLK